MAEEQIMHIIFYKKLYTKRYIRRPRKEDSSIVLEEIHINWA
jgi:hypothetical protein